MLDRPAHSLIARARIYMGKKYGRDVSADDTGHLFYMNDTRWGPARHDIGYVCADGKLVDSTGDSDALLTTLGR